MEIFFGGFVIILACFGLSAIGLSLYVAYSGIQHRRAMEINRLVADTQIATMEQEAAYLAAGKLANTTGGEGFVDPKRGMLVAPTVTPNVAAHYAPHVVYQNRGELRGREIEEAPALADAAAPSFRDMWQARIFKPDSLVRGIEAGQPVDMPILLASVMALGGLPGSGKTTAERFFAGQRVAVGSKLVALDPHGDVGDQSLIATLAPLTPFYALPPAIANKDIAAVLREVLAEVERRKKDAAARAVGWLVMIDELNAIMRSPNAELAAQTIRVLGEEARKLNIQGFVSGQNWKAEEVGGSPVRDALALRTCTRMIPLQAQRLIPTINRDVFELPNGMAYSYAGGDLRRLIIPNVTGDDLAYLAAQLAAPVAESRPEIGQEYAEVGAAYSASETPEIASAEAVEAARLFFVENIDPAAIVKRLHGLDSKAGAKYQQALKDVLNLIREGRGFV